MSFFEIIAVLITLSALLSYINVKLIKLPSTIGLMALALALSVGLNIAGIIWPKIIWGAKSFLELVDFNRALLHGMLAFLLFAGALHVNISQLSEQKTVIAVLALFGTLTWGSMHSPRQCSHRLIFDQHLLLRYFYLFLILLDLLVY
jgi:CPA1 family monovalent cation:H+ antiporter